MYKLKDGTEHSILEQYGFKLGKDWKDSESVGLYGMDRSDYWLFPVNEFGNIEKSESDLALWSIHVQDSGLFWIDCVPDSTYHIDNLDMEEMFYVLMQLISAGLIIDTYERK